MELFFQTISTHLLQMLTKPRLVLVLLSKQRHAEEPVDVLREVLYDHNSKLRASPFYLAAFQQQLYQQLTAELIAI